MAALLLLAIMPTWSPGRALLDAPEAQPPAGEPQVPAWAPEDAAAPQDAAAPEEAAGSALPAVACRDDGRGGQELWVAGTAAMRFPRGGVDPVWRCSTVADRLRRALASGVAPREVRPGVLRGQAVVMAGRSLLATVLRPEAARNQVSPAVLAWIWSNRLRSALDAPELDLTAIPFRGLPGVRRVVASWYGHGFSGRRTASGVPFDPLRHTAAHRRLPFGTVVRVINPRTGKQVLAVVNDRGPFVPGRELDLSYGAARELGMLGAGVAAVYMEVVRAPFQRLIARGP